MKRKNNTLKIFSLLFLAAVISMAITTAFYFNYQKSLIYDAVELNATLRIGNFVGLSTDSSVLDFGTVTPGGNSRKEVVMYHEYDKPLNVRVIYLGNISDFLSPVEPFVLEPKTEKKIGIIAYAKSGVYGSYSGKVIILYLKK